MKKIGILNQPLSEVIAGMGHGDSLVIADCGLPVPAGVRRIDLALTAGIPSFLETLNVVLQEMQIESFVLAREMTEVSPGLFAQIQEIMEAVPCELVSHEEFKASTRQAVAVIRTGECTSYANIILKSGVIF